MQQLAADLEQLIRQAKPALDSVDPSKLSGKPLPNKWSKKEIIGHMIDSAQSNIRRFVVAQYEEIPHIVYNQDKWVALSNYQQFETGELLQLWYLLNVQISKIFVNTDPSMATRLCQTKEAHSIEWLAEDYIKHLKHHLHQVLNLEPVPYP